jgi:hypothetical protein
MMVKIHVEVLWVVKPCSVVVGYKRFTGPCCLHLEGEVAGMRENGIDNRPGLERATGAISQ